MSNRLRYLQVFGDALIPLLGFFFWNWSLYFILLYYLIDLFMGELLAHLKTRKIIHYTGNKTWRSWIGYGIFSFSLFVLVGFLIHVGLYLLHPDIAFRVEALAFWNYEELGVKQGHVLLPLMIFVTFQRYKLEFLLTGMYTRMKIRDLWRDHLRQYPVLIAACGLVIGVSYFIRLEDVFYLIGIVVLSGLYRYFVSRRMV
jgi:hypothetical protein